MQNKIITLCLSLIFFIGTEKLFAKEVPIEVAQRLAKKALVQNTNARSNAKITNHFTKNQNGQNVYYIFNFSPKGFVIISAEDSYNPILAFSDESSIDFEADEKNIGLWGTLSVHEQRIEYSRANQLQASAAVQAAWRQLRQAGQQRFQNTVVVAPLTTTKWNQGTYYNAQCPADENSAIDGPDGRTYCGCTPVAMAQLIKYHNYPPNGNGFNSYVDPIYGTLSGDFCNTTYNWGDMPDELTDYNADVAELIYHMGVSVFTHYSTSYTETYTSYVRDAYVNFFGFDQAANWFYDVNNDFPWVARNDLDRSRPVLLTGLASDGAGHTWVADGYGYFTPPGASEDANYFHFNWGWGGDNNGWFLDTGTQWTPRADQPENQAITYYWDRYVVHNLFPAGEACQSPENVYANGVENNVSYLNVYYPSGDQEIAFRYREAGQTDWTETTPSYDYYYLLQNLTAGTSYEFQARRKCCPDNWSDYSEIQSFTTSGRSPCAPLLASDLSTSSISDHNAYIYTTQPHGVRPNQFRYRSVGSSDWILTDISSNHYRYLSDLKAGTEYEFQVSHECDGGNFAPFSESLTFKTTGTANSEGNPDGSDNNCPAISGSQLTISSTGDHNTYIYTPQTYGVVTNQFRYRPVGTTEWTFSSSETTYYRYLSDLEAGTEYEFQVRHECESGQWSNYSDSGYFTTTGMATDGSTGDGDGNNGGDNTGSSDCEPVSTDGLFTSSVGPYNAYIYTPQPYGAIPNEFRYRPVGAADWTLSDISTSYYRYLSNLSSATNYEYQVRHECTASNWSNFSDSHYFSTTGATAHSKISSQVPLSLQEVNAQAKKSNGAISQLWSSKQHTMSLFPNPASEELFFNHPTGFKKNDILKLYDLQGKVIKTIQLSEDDTQKRIHIGDMTDGLYFLQYATKTGLKLIKFVKK